MSAIGKKGNQQVGAKLKKLSKARLIELILEERETARLRLEEKDKRIAELSEKLASVQRQHDEQSNGQKIRDINKHVNEPSSKKPEWDKDGNPKPPKNRRKKKKKRKKRPGCGNGSKSNVVPDETHDIPLDACPCCGTDLAGQGRHEAPWAYGRRYCAARGEDDRIRGNNALEVVSYVQEDGLFKDGKGTSGLGYRSERHHRNGLFMGHECVVLAEDPGRCPLFPGARALNGGYLEDDDSVERHTAAGL